MSQAPAASGVEADVGVRAWGPTRAEAFAQAALGVMALTVLPDEVEARESREVRAQAESPEALLVAWVNECLYVHEIEGPRAAERARPSATRCRRRISSGTPPRYFTVQRRGNLNPSASSV